jgi:hypothetical protein
MREFIERGLIPLQFGDPDIHLRVIRRPKESACIFFHRN